MRRQKKTFSTKKPTPQFNLSVFMRGEKFTKEERESVRFMHKDGWSREEVETFIRNGRADRRRAERRKRAMRFIEMRIDREMSYRQIAEQEGLSVERVRQILKLAEHEEGISLPERISRKKEPITIATRCAVCKEIVEVVSYLHKEGRNYYCAEHKRTNRKSIRFVLACPNWKDMTAKERTRWKYHNDPGYRKMHQESVKRYHSRVMKTPEFKKRVKEYTKKWRVRKLKENPNYFKELDARRKSKKAARIQELRSRLSVIHNGDNIPTMNGS